MYDVIIFVIVALPVVLLFSLLSFYINKFFKNVKKNEKFAWTLIFIHPSAPKAFKILTITTLIFSIGWVIRLLADFFFIYIPFLGAIITYLILLGYVHFFRTLVEITKGK